MFCLCYLGLRGFFEKTLGIFSTITFHRRTMYYSEKNMKRTDGTAYYLFSLLCFFVARLLIKVIPQMPSFEIVFIRSLVSLSLSYSVIHRKKLSVLGTNWKDLLFRGIFGSFGMLTFFYSLQHLALGTATALTNLSPIFTIFFAGFFLGEKTKKQEWILFFIAFLGVMLLKGVDGKISLFDFLVGLSSAIFSGAAYNFIRKIKDKENPHVIVFSLSFVSIPLFIPFVIATWKTPSLLEIVIMLLVGVVTQLAQVNMTKAHQTSKTASSIMHYAYLDVVLSVIVGYWLFHEPCTWLSMIGIGVILSSVYLIRLSQKKAALVVSST